MVRLVFRPYTQVGRPICTSGPLRTSTRVSSGFALPRHSSPSFGYYRARSCSTSPTERARRAGGAPDPSGPGSHLSRHAPALTFIAPRGLFHPLTRVCVRLLGPCFKTGQVASRHRRRPLTPFTRADPRPGDVTRLGTGLRTVRPGRQSHRRRGTPSLPREGERRRSEHYFHGPRKRRFQTGALRKTREGPSPYTPPFLADPEPVAAHHQRRKCARRGHASGRGEVPAKGSSRTDRPTKTTPS